MKIVKENISKREATRNAKPALRIIRGGDADQSAPQPQLKRTFAPTDTGNAEALAHLFGDRIRYVPAWGVYIIYDGTHWRRDIGGVALMKLTKGVIGAINGDPKWRKRSQERARREAMMALVRSEVGTIEPEQLDADPFLFACRNGVIDLKTGELLPHDPKHLIMKIAPVDFDPKACARKWEAFLREILPNEDVRDFLQRVFGYALTGDIGERILVVLLGLGRNGKSLLLRTIQIVIGPYAKTTAAELLMAKDHTAHPTEIADLLGTRLAISSEVKKGRTFDEEAVKRLTGDDRLKARRMREDFWEFDPTHKLVIAANHRPRVRDTTDSFWDRFRLVPFPIRIADKKVNPRLRAELLKESAGILNWLIEGYRKYQQHGLEPPQAVLDATKDYRAREDVLGQFFLEHCVFGGSNDFESSADLLDRARKWAAALNFHVPSAKALAERLEEHGCKSEHKNTGNGWTGVRLKPVKQRDKEGGKK